MKIVIYGKILGENKLKIGYLKARFLNGDESWGKTDESKITALVSNESE